MERLFFDLIQVSIGCQNCLSRTPNEAEWGELYSLAKKQSLVGVCFAGVQRLVTQQQEPPEMLYLTWMGMAAKIQQRNDVVNRQCAELQAKFAADGLRSCILKGQGVAQVYSESLRGLRQSGDIDIWVPGGMQKTMAYVKAKFGDVSYDYINAHLPVYSDTEVELHWRVSQMFNLFKNHRLQKWLVSEDGVRELLGGRVILPDGAEIVVPTIEFNAFYILLHAYAHMFTEGLGLRQLMDYFFVLKALDGRNSEKIACKFKEYSLSRFAAAVMWIMQSVFGLEERCMIVAPNEKEGRFILDEVMMNGNFGHHDDRVKHLSNNSKVNSVLRNIQHNWHMAKFYPSAIFWNPVWIVYHFLWKRTSGRV